MKYLSLLIFFFLLASCRETEHETLITGRLAGLENTMLHFDEVEIRKTIPIDSTETGPEGSFAFSPEIMESGFYILRTNPEDYIMLVVSPGEKISIRGSIKNYDISGSEASRLYEKYHEQSIRNETWVDSLAGIVRERNLLDDQGRLSPEYKNKFDSVLNAQEDFARNLIDNNPGSLASLLILNQRFGRKPLFDIEDDLQLFSRVDSALMERYPENKHAIDHHQRLSLKRRELQEKEQAAKRLEIGKEIPDVSLKDTSGQAVSLHSLKGKNVIMYFWSALDGRSRQSNHELKKLYKRLNHKEYAIYAISLDPGREIWKNAVKLDELNWINVNDPEGSRSAVIKLYNLPANLPYYYLLDKDSRIIFKGQDPEKLKYAIEQP